MTDAFADKQPDPGYFVCYYCSQKIEGPLPPGVWTKGVVAPQHRYVCLSCRQGGNATGSPRPDPSFYRCLGCHSNQPIPEVERRNWMRDPDSRINYFDDGSPKYVGFCPGCAADQQAHREAVERARRIIARRAGEPHWQMVHVRELQRAFEVELTSEGSLRYDREQAIACAVELEMLVADWARHAEFMQWERDRRHSQQVDEQEAA